MVLLLEKKEAKKHPSFGSSAGIFTYNDVYDELLPLPQLCFKEIIGPWNRFFSPKFLPRRFGQVALVTKKGQAITLRSTDGQQPQSNLVAWQFSH